MGEHSEHADTDINTHQKYSEKHTETGCSTATSDKYMPHPMCVHGLKYTPKIINMHIFS